MIEAIVKMEWRGGIHFVHFELAVACRHLLNSRSRVSRHLFTIGHDKAGDSLQMRSTIVNNRFKEKVFYISPVKVFVAGRETR